MPVNDFLSIDILLSSMLHKLHIPTHYTDQGEKKGSLDERNIV